jgi:phosphatidyl-myo-inositol dimannoside synthase
MLSRTTTKKILFYYLSAFSHTGGIEKFNRCFIKALNELPADEFSNSVVSVYDNNCDERYNASCDFKGFGKSRAKSVAYLIKASHQQDVVVLGHINLAVAGWLIKKLRPKCKVIVIAHGIEVWDKLQFFKKWCLQSADQIFAVSNYTKNQLVLRNQIGPEKISLFPNTIDPYFAVPDKFEKPVYLLDRYNINVATPVILTLSRLSSSEQYKGYDKVIAALPSILDKHPKVVYILAGKYDEKEKDRIEHLLKVHGVTNNVIITGYVKDEEVSDHYRLADVFIMPSRKEGFGIVFLEALACGTRVVGGNQDGTVDALLNGSLGKLINPTKIQEIGAAIINQLSDKSNSPLYYQEKVLKQYQFSRYRDRLLQLLR